MLEPVDDGDRRSGGRGQPGITLWALAITPLALGLGLLASERGPAVAWALIVCGAGFASVLVAERRR